MKYFFELTKYPKLFKNTYWGCFNTNGRTEEDIREIKKIVENRNRFVEEYQITKKEKREPKYVREKLNEISNKFDGGLDHLEIYKTQNNEYIILNSPYIKKDSKCYSKLKDGGWEEVENLYFDNAISFIIKFKKENKTNNKEYFNNYYQEHNKNKYFDCECGKKVKCCNKEKHNKTKHHVIFSIISKNEMPPFDKFMEMMGNKL